MLVCGKSGRVRANPGGTAGVMLLSLSNQGQELFCLSFEERGWPRDGGLVAADTFGENYQYYFYWKGLHL